MAAESSPHPTLWSKRSLFRPLGNGTPAVDFTQDLPLAADDGQRQSPDARILLLGGAADPRSILYTVHLCSSSNKVGLDMTCCDAEPAVLARNALLLTLICSSHNYPIEHIFSIFHHPKLSSGALSTLCAHASDLVEASASLDAWKKSTYSKAFLRVCDRHTLSLLRRFWTLYAIAKSANDKLIAPKPPSPQPSPTTIGLSAGSFLFLASQTLTRNFSHFWKYGTIDVDPIHLSKSTRVNPTFAYSALGDKCELDYERTYPLSGFLLSGAFVGKEKVAFKDRSIADLIGVAKNQFGRWCESFRTTVSSRMGNQVTIRLFCGSPLAFCSTLSYWAHTGAPSALQYISPFSNVQIILDGGDYGLPEHCTHPAPGAFDVIDTGDMMSHFGVWNVLLAVGPLLAERGVLYTLGEDTPPPPTTTATSRKSLKHAKSAEQLYLSSPQHPSSFTSSSIPTLAILFDLVPTAFVTRFTTHVNAEQLFYLQSGREEDAAQAQAVSRGRTSWRRPSLFASCRQASVPSPSTDLKERSTEGQPESCQDSATHERQQSRAIYARLRPHIGPEDLARILLSIMHNMLHFNTSAQQQHQSHSHKHHRFHRYHRQHDHSPSISQHYHSATLALLMRTIRQQGLCEDWDAFINAFFQGLMILLVQVNVPTTEQAIGSWDATGMRMIVPELLLQMYLQGACDVLYSLPASSILLSSSLETSAEGARSSCSSPFAGWTHIPDIVVVVLIVPRSKLVALHHDNEERRGMMQVHFSSSSPSASSSSVSSPSASESAPENTAMFTALQCVFGHVSTSGSGEDTRLIVKEDEKAWRAGVNHGGGGSGLIIWVKVPSAVFSEGAGEVKMKTRVALKLRSGTHNEEQTTTVYETQLEDATSHKANNPDVWILKDIPYPTSLLDSFVSSSSRSVLSYAPTLETSPYPGSIIASSVHGSSSVHSSGSGSSGSSAAGSARGSMSPTTPVSPASTAITMIGGEGDGPQFEDDAIPAVFTFPTSRSSSSNPSASSPSSPARYGIEMLARIATPSEAGPFDAKMAVRTKRIGVSLMKVLVGDNIVKILAWPLPFEDGKTRATILQKEGLIEVVAQVLSQYSTGFVSPCDTILYNQPVPFTAAPTNSETIAKAGPVNPILWNTHRIISLSSLPIFVRRGELDPSCDWLNIHTASAISSQDRLIKERWEEHNVEQNGDDKNDSLPLAPMLHPIPILTRLKYTLHSLFVLAVQEPQIRIFALTSRSGRGHLGTRSPFYLMFINDLRVDIASGSVVADCAVLPLEDPDLQREFSSDFFPSSSTGECGRFVEILEKALSTNPTSIVGPAVVGLEVDGDEEESTEGGRERKAWCGLMKMCVERVRITGHRVECDDHDTRSSLPSAISVFDGDDEKETDRLCICGRGANLGSLFNDVVNACEQLSGPTLEPPASMNGNAQSSIIRLNGSNKQHQNPSMPRLRSHRSSSYLSTSGYSSLSWGRKEGSRAQTGNSRRPEELVRRMMAYARRAVVSQMWGVPGIVEDYSSSTSAGSHLVSKSGLSTEDKACLRARTRSSSGSGSSSTSDSASGSNVASVDDDRRSETSLTGFLSNTTASDGRSEEDVVGSLRSPSDKTNADVRDGNGNTAWSAFDPLMPVRESAGVLCIGSSFSSFGTTSSTEDIGSSSRPALISTGTASETSSSIASRPSVASTQPRTSRRSVRSPPAGRASSPDPSATRRPISPAPRRATIPTFNPLDNATDMTSAHSPIPTRPASPTLINAFSVRPGSPSLLAARPASPVPARPSSPAPIPTRVISPIPARPTSSSFQSCLINTFSTQTASPNGMIPAPLPTRPGSLISGQRICDTCGGEGQPILLRCSGCRAVYYCGAECQQKDWNDHKMICQQVQRGEVRGW